MNSENNSLSNKIKTKHLHSIVATVYSIIIASTFFMMPIYFQSILGFSTSEIGFILAAMSITALLSILPSGISNDFITSRRVAIIGLVILIIAFVLLYFLRTFLSILLVMVFIGSARELFRISLETFVFKANDLNQMPESLGNFHGPRMIGLFLGMIIASFILQNFNFNLLFLIIAVSLLLPLILVFYLPDVPISRSTPKEYKEELIRPSIIVFMLFCFIFTSHWGAEYVNYGLFLKNELLLSDSQSAIYISVEFLIIGIILPIFGKAYKKTRIEYSTPIAIILSGIGHIFMVNNDVLISLIFRGIHGIGDGLLVIILYMIIAENFSKERIGGLNAVVNFVMMAGMLLGSIIFGYLGENFGSGFSMVVSGIITIFSTPIIYIWFGINKKNYLKNNG
ncbi:MAG: MFS transporter [Deltaproteobacteria bacterium]|nr:MFS transporter [Deltaproteobacteria bacterium]